MVTDKIKTRFVNITNTIFKMMLIKMVLLTFHAIVSVLPCCLLLPLLFLPSCHPLFTYFAFEKEPTRFETCKAINIYFAFILQVLLGW